MTADGPPPLPSKPLSPPPLPLVESGGSSRIGVGRPGSRRRVVLAAGALVVVVAAFVVAHRLSASRRLAACRELASRYGRAAGLDPALVMAVIQVESKGRRRAVSRAGARGLMQLMPPTAAEVAAEARIDPPSRDELFDPDLNVRLGTLYLAKLRRQFRDDPYLYIAAYNAGPGNVDKWQLQHPTLTPREIIDQVAFGETRAYVRRVMAAWGRTY